MEWPSKKIRDCWGSAKGLKETWSWWLPDLWAWRRKWGTDRKPELFDSKCDSHIMWKTNPEIKYLVRTCFGIFQTTVGQIILWWSELLRPSDLCMCMHTCVCIYCTALSMGLASDVVACGNEQGVLTTPVEPWRYRDGFCVERTKESAFPSGVRAGAGTGFTWELGGTDWLTCLCRACRHRWAPSSSLWYFQWSPAWVLCRALTTTTKLLLLFLKLDIALLFQGHKLCSLFRIVWSSH